MDFDLEARTILLTVGGSRAYGIHTPESDVDVKGVGIAPTSYYHGFSKNWEQASGDNIAVFKNYLSESEEEAVKATKLEGDVYELRKFMKLAIDCNPNILDVLFCRDAEVRLANHLGLQLRENRELFLSAKAKHTFSGYAASQLKRIKGHRAWLLNPPTHPPTRDEFGLPEHTTIPKDQLMAAQAVVKKQIDSWEFDLHALSEADNIHVTTQIANYMSEVLAHLGYPVVDDGKWLAAARMVGLDDNLIYIMQKEREYEAAQTYFKQYQNWQKNRNPARAELEAKHLYDTKHAAHLFRLLKMGREILETGKVHVWRGHGGAGDAEEILAIRRGAWSYDALVTWAEAEDKALEVLYRAQQYVVPKEPNRAAADRLCCELIEAML